MGREARNLVIRPQPADDATLLLGDAFVVQRHQSLEDFRAPHRPRPPVRPGHEGVDFVAQVAADAAGGELVDGALLWGERVGTVRDATYVRTWPKALRIRFSLATASPVAFPSKAKQPAR